MQPWHQMSGEAVLERLQSSGQGLTDGEVRRRLAWQGPNILLERKGRTALGIFLGQFTDVMILVLIAAAVVFLAVEGEKWVKRRSGGVQSAWRSGSG